MTNSTIFKKAHILAKAIKAENAWDYRSSFSAALRIIYAQIRRDAEAKAEAASKAETFYMIADWFFKKGTTSAQAFSSRQIVGGSEKAVKIRTSVQWGGTDILKEIWLPRSVVREVSAEEAADWMAYDVDFIIRSIDADCFAASKKYAQAVAYEFC